MTGRKARRSPEAMSEQRAVYVISVAADLAGVHPQTLRIYERKGLLAPQRTAGNTRRYSEHDVETLRRIQQLTQDEGVNLAGVRMIMDLERRLAEMQAQLEGVRRQVAEVEREMRRNPRWGVLARLEDVRSIFQEDKEDTWTPTSSR
jgi:MerR family transcriptional regulator/heat shock protein HspR